MAKDLYLSEGRVMGPDGQLDLATAFLNDPVVNATYRPAPLGRRWVFLGDSETVYGDNTDTKATGDSWPNLLAIASMGRIEHVRNAGMNGNSTTQMIDRFATDVAAYDPEVVTLHLGTAALTTMTVPAIKADIATLVGMVRAIGATPVMLTNFPRNDTETMRNDTLAIGQFVREYADANHILCVDTYTSLVDPATGGIKAVYDDGSLYHLNASGRTHVADLMLSAVSSFLSPVPRDLLAASSVETANFVKNPLLLTDADSNGLADQWAAFGDVTAGSVRSRVAASSPDVGYWQRIATDATISTSTNAGFFTNGTMATTGWAVGDLMRFACRVKFTPTAGGNATVRLLFTGTTEGHPSRFLEPTYQPVDGVISRTFRVPAGATAMDFYAYLSGQGTLQIAQPRLVNLTALGLDAL